METPDNTTSIPLATISIPLAIEAIPVLSWTEKKIINKIVSLSHIYLKNGGCNLSNENMANRHMCGITTVKEALNKAKKLGFTIDRQDICIKHVDSGGNATGTITQKRTIQMAIPEIWMLIGEIWGDFYFKGNEDAREVIEWINDEFKNNWNEWEDEWNEAFSKELLTILHSKKMIHKE
jgi:hypothetical protein